MFFLKVDREKRMTKEAEDKGGSRELKTEDRKIGMGRRNWKNNAGTTQERRE